ncbi:MAG: ZIP family metal transporter [Deltaproteobacteria bacterium]|nr:ZIP family metal transporter [Deltaproteobacteria bacterium]
MPVLAWIVLSGLLMSSLALVGSLTLLLPDRTFRALVLPLVALSAGSLIGGALFHLLPASIHDMEGIAPFVWTLVGFATLFVLEQFLHWHHCHRPMSEHRAPLGWFILVADGIHNFVGGLACAGAFLVDVRLGIVTWIVEAAHEVPQELGDFGILIHAGWSKRRALVFNLLSGLTYLAGGLVAWAVSRSLDVTFLMAFGAGNFLYIAAADLIPEIKQEARGVRAVVHFLSFATGVLMLLGLRLLLPESMHAGG